MTHGTRFTPNRRWGAATHSWAWRVRGSGDVCNIFSSKDLGTLSLFTRQGDVWLHSITFRENTCCYVLTKCLAGLILKGHCHRVIESIRKLRRLSAGNRLVTAGWHAGECRFMGRSKSRFHNERYAMRFFISAACVFTVVLAMCGCVGTTTRVEPGSEVVHDPTGPTVKDFQAICQVMARSLVQLPQFQNAAEPPTIVFSEVENRSNDYIDKKAFLERIRTLLVKHGQGRLRFLDRDKLEELREEQRAKEAGELTSSGDAKFLGADFLLTGSISSINRGQGGKSTVYRRFSFRLTDARTSVVIWEDEYETQVVHNRAWIYE